MKNIQFKNIIIPALLVGFSVGINAQVFSSGFENNNGPISDWTTINADQNPIEDWMPVPEFNEEAWIQFYDFYDNKIAFSTSFYMNGEPANDWLISPPIEIPTDGSPTLYWKAKSYDSTAQDTYAVKISTTTAEMESFTNLLVVEGEQAYEFNSRTLDLSAYSGQSVYLAFVNETNGGYFLALDDVYISTSEDCYAPSVETFSSVINANSYLSNPNADNISFTVSWDAMDNVQLYNIGVTTFNVPVTSNGTIAENTKLFTDMELGTRYQMFVKNADCGSGWTGPKSIFTPSALPYKHSFEPTVENYGEYDSDGWTSDTWIMGVNSDLAFEGEGYIFSNTSSSSETNKWLYSYPIVIGENEPIELMFDAAFTNGAADSGLLKIGLTTSNEVGTYPSETQSFDIVPGYNTITATFENHPGGIVYVAFGNVSPMTTESYALRVDNVQINKGSLSVEDMEVRENISIYPNPVRDHLNLVTTKRIQEVNIFSLDGKLVNNITDPKSNLEVIQVNHLANGVYVLQINTGDVVITRKFIKK
ncbi:T9SS type A sorting domain-containing protein [Flavobacteriaceae bacterium Ap0902]|nr:T9SS type A sorting domain-containing protein [Flavobacteriaceae bacterium Ap0902]